MDLVTVKNSGRIYINGDKSNFYVHEFVAPEILQRWKNGALRCIDDRIVIATQLLRTETGLSTTVNSYGFGGPYKDSGTRSPMSYTRMRFKMHKDKGLTADSALEACKMDYLNTYSLHKSQQAADLKIGNLTSFQMVALIQDEKNNLTELGKKLMEIGVRRIENPQDTKGRNRGWLHMDLAWTGLDHIQIVDA